MSQTESRADFFKRFKSSSKAATPAAESVADVADSVADPQSILDAPVSRKGALRILAGTVAAAAAPQLFSSCKSKDPEPDKGDPNLDTLATMTDETGRPYDIFANLPTDTPNVTRGQAALYYEATGPQVVDYTKNAKDFVVEPARAPKSQNLKNAVAYVSSTGINQRNDSAELKALSATISAMDGFLKDKNGNPVADPNGPNALMVDLRKPDVFNAMKSYVKQLSRDYQGVFLDAVDSSVAVENAARAQGDTAILGSNGSERLPDAALRLIQTCAAEIRAESGQSKRIIVNTSFAQRTDTSQADIVNVIGRMRDVNMIATESRYYETKGQIWKTVDAYEWTMNRMRKMFSAAADAGITQLNLFGLEPAGDGKQEQAACRASVIYQKWAKDLVPAGKNLTVNATIYTCDGHNKIADLAANAEFGKNPSLSCGR